MLPSGAMGGALEGRVVPGPIAALRVRAAQLAGPALLAAAALVVGGALLRGGGSTARPLFWIGGVAVLASAAAATGILAGLVARPRLGRAGTALVLLLAGYAAWTGATVVWSIEPDRSWEAFNRVVAYLAVLGLGVLVGSARRAAPLLALLLGLTLAWALATAVVPAIGPDVERSARLREPVEYWNALALVAAMSLPLWLWLARARRPAAAVALFAAAVALLLTASRGGLLVAVAAVAVWLALVRPRRESAGVLLVALPPAVAVGALGLWLERDTGSGLVLGAALAGAGALVFLLARRPPPPWAGRALIALCLAAAVAGAAVAVPRAGAWWDEFRNPPATQTTQDPARLGELSSNHRWTWWTQAWTIFRADPGRGSGAGSYELARRPLRGDTLGPIDPHNLGLKALSETGVVGFLLLFGAIGAAVAAASATLRRTAGEERAAAVALAAGVAAWLLHSLVDMPWEYAAVTVPAMFALGVLVASGRPAPAPGGGGPVLAAVPALVALALVGSLAFPWLAERRLEASLDALTRGDHGSAATAAQQAQALNPLAVRPLHLEATALELAGRLDGAEALYEEAVRLQPRNPQTWYELGRFEFMARGDLAEALVYLDRSWGLDRQSPDTGPLLDRVREEISRRRG